MLKVVILSETTVVKEMRGEDEAPTEHDLEKGSLHWYGAFKLAATVQPGCVVVLQRPFARMYNGAIKFSGEVSLLKVSSFETLKESVPMALYQLPNTLADLVKQEMLVLVFDPEAPSNALHPVAYTQGYTENVKDIYIRRDREDVEHIGAYIAGYRGYPVAIAADAETNQVLSSVKSYDNHYRGFGVTNTKVWVALAPLFMNELAARMVVHVDKKATEQLEVNLAGGAVPTHGFQYVVAFGCNVLELDMPKMLSRVGFQVSFSYVRRHFGSVTYLKSPHADANQLYQRRAQGKVVNLSEYNGPLEDFADGWKFYAVVDCYHDTGMTAEEILELRSETASNEQRAAALEGNMVKFTTQHIFTCKA